MRPGDALQHVSYLVGIELVVEVLLRIGRLLAGGGTGVVTAVATAVATAGGGELVATGTPVVVIATAVLLLEGGCSSRSSSPLDFLLLSIDELFQLDLHFQGVCGDRITTQIPPVVSHALRLLVYRLGVYMHACMHA